MMKCVFSRPLQVQHVEKRFSFTKAHNREAKIFNILFDETTIPADLLWKNRGRPPYFIERTELPALPTLCNLIGRIFHRQKLVPNPDWQANNAQGGWRLAYVDNQITNVFGEMWVTRKI